MREVGGIDAEVARFFVNGAALGEERVERGPGVVGLQEGAAAVAGNALEEGVRMSVEPSDDTEVAEGGKIGGAGNDAAAGCEHDATDTDEVSEDRGLEFSKSLFATGGEDFANGLARSLDDEFVGIDEAVPG